MKYYNEECCKIAFFIKSFLILLFLYLIEYYTHAESNTLDGDLLKFGFNLGSFERYIFINVIATNLTLGITKDFHIKEIIPFINLPIKKDLFITIFIATFYFDFSFLFLLFLILFVISLIGNLSSVDLTGWNYLVIFYSVIFQQIGFVIKIFKLSIFLIFLILLFFVLGLILIFNGSAYHNLLQCFPNKPFLFFAGGSLCVSLLYITKNYLRKNIIEYL
jgi:hypothetical protein